MIAPRLRDFARSDPEVALNLPTRLRPFAIQDSTLHAAIPFGPEDWPGSEGEKHRQLLSGLARRPRNRVRAGIFHRLARRTGGPIGPGPARNGGHAKFSPQFYLIANYP